MKTNIKVIFIIGFVLKACILSFSQDKPLFWKNPIRSGLNPYGIKDIFLIPQGEKYYLVGTEYKNPNLKSEIGVQLYSSANLKDWNTEKRLIVPDRNSTKAWCYDIFNAPEIHAYKNKFYLIFNGGNSRLNPYKKTGFGIAVSDKIDGPYKILNTAKPLFESNHATLTFDEQNEPFVVFEMDGRFYSAKINLEKGLLESKPLAFLGPKELGSNYKYLDVPQFFFKDGKYHLLFSQFYGGYIVKVFHYMADSLFGKYTQVEKDPIYTWLEAEADETPGGDYPTKNGFAPPTQVVFSNQIVELQKGKYAIAYHSSEKYAEPTLCIDTFNWVGDSINLNSPKANFQGFNFSTSVKKVESHGYQNCLEIKNEYASVIIEPNLGGRVLVYAIEGKNIMYIDTTKNGWTFKKNGFTQPTAGRFDIGPEAIMPKRNATWVGSYTTEIIDNSTVRITSEKDSVLGIQVIREFSLAESSSHLKCTQIVKNISTKELKSNHWGRTFALGGGIAMIPKNPKSRFPKGYCIYRPPLNSIDFKPAEEPNISLTDDIIVIKNIPSDPKFVMDNSEGWLAYCAPNNLLFVKKYPVYQDRNYGEVTAATSSIWYYKDTMVEIEPIGPLETLQPGASYTFTEDWWLIQHDFPKERNANISKIKQLIEVLK